MKRFTLLVVLSSLLPAQRPKPAYDPDTKEGLLIQHIEQERDPAEKLRYMEQFAAQFPANPAAGWVYDQLQPVYIDAKAWDAAMRIGQKRVELEPENLDAAKLGLKAAESKGDREQMAKWADVSWTIGSRLSAKGGRNAEDARQTQLYAEYTLFTLAQQTEDLSTRLGLLTALEERDPKGPYAEIIPAQCFEIYRKLHQMDKAMALADKTLAAEPDNLDMLMAVAESRFGHEDGQEKVAQQSGRIVEILRTKPRPENLTEEDWAKKKAHLLGIAYYMGGVTSTLTGEVGRGDQWLRLAVPLVAGDATQEATAFYYLGIANYRLADKDPARAKEALAYWLQCAALHSNFEQQAVKDAASIRNEFDLP